MKNNRQAAVNRSMSNEPSGRATFIKLMLARLQAVLSRNMYSEHGLLALIRPEFGHLCQRLVVVSYRTPGSPQCHAQSAMRSNNPFASYTGPGRVGSVTHRVDHLPFRATVSMNSSVTRTDRFAFW